MENNHLFTAERDWILRHPELYLGPLHQQAVIGNIQKRYEINALKRQIQKLTTSN
jgi:hypothetical protein